jgi:hypothetical protein
MKTPTISTTVVLGFAASGLLAAPDPAPVVVPLSQRSLPNGGKDVAVQVSIGPQSLMLRLMNGAAETWVNPRCSAAGAEARICGANEYHAPKPNSKHRNAVPGTGSATYMVSGGATFGFRKDHLALDCEWILSHVIPFLSSRSTLLMCGLISAGNSPLTNRPATPKVSAIVRFGDVENGARKYTSDGLGIGVFGLSSKPSSGETEGQFLDVLVSEHKIAGRLYSLALGNNVMVLGGVDRAQYEGEPVRLPCSSVVGSENGCVTSFFTGCEWR